MNSCLIIFYTSLPYKFQEVWQKGTSWGWVGWNNGRKRVGCFSGLLILTCRDISLYACHKHTRTYTNCSWLDHLWGGCDNKNRMSEGNYLSRRNLLPPSSCKESLSGGGMEKTLELCSMLGMRGLPKKKVIQGALTCFHDEWSTSLRISETNFKAKPFCLKWKLIWVQILFWWGSEHPNATLCLFYLCTSMRSSSNRQQVSGLTFIQHHHLN